MTFNRNWPFMNQPILQLGMTNIIINFHLFCSFSVTLSFQIKDPMFAGHLAVGDCLRMSLYLCDWKTFQVDAALWCCLYKSKKMIEAFTSQRYHYRYQWPGYGPLQMMTPLTCQMSLKMKFFLHSYVIWCEVK